MNVKIKLWGFFFSFNRALALEAMGHSVTNEVIYQHGLDAKSVKGSGTSDASCCSGTSFRSDCESEFT